MPRYRTRLYYKNLVDNIVNWLNSDIDEWTANDLFNDPKVEIKNAIADNSRDLKEKIDLYLEGQDEF